MKPPEGSSVVFLLPALPKDRVSSRNQPELQSVLTALEECRASLAVSAEHETADLVSMAILLLRMKLEGVSENELKLLCETVGAEALQTEARLAPKRSRERRRRPPALRLVED